jgi:hypothetical protein
MAERRPSAGSSALNAIAQFNAGVVDNTLGLLDLGAQGVAGISNMITGRNDRPVMLGQRAKSALNVESDPSSPSYIAGSVAPAVATGVGAMAKQGVTSLRNFFGGSTAELGGYFGGEAGAQLGREYGGDYGEMAGGLVGGMAAPNAPRSEIISAGHASPHQFERFSMDKIGTGEGAQVYGHGLYFAENPRVVDEYYENFNQPVLRFKERNIDTPYTAELRDRFKDVYEGLINYDAAREWKENVLDRAYDAGWNVDEVDDELNALFKNVFERAESPKDFEGIDFDSLGIDPNDIYDLADQQLVLDNVLGGISQASSMEDLNYVLEGFSPDEMRLYRDLVEPELAEIRDSASRYDVNLNVDPDELLDWDRPLTEQPRALNAIKQLYLDDMKRIDANSPDGEPKLSELYTSVDDVSMHDLGLFNRSKGSQAYNTIASSNMGRGAEQLSRKLKERGIKGIKYFDGFSRLSSNGTLDDVFQNPQGEWQSKIVVGGGTGATISMPFKTKEEAIDWAKNKISKGTSNYVIFDDSLIDTKRVNDQLTPSWMDQGARMQRAQELGYDTSRPLYHYTDKLENETELSSLQPSPENVQTKLGRGIYTSPNPQYGDRYVRQGRDLSEGYNENARAIPVYARGKLATGDEYEAAYKAATDSLGIQRGVVDQQTKLKIRSNIQNKAQEMLKEQGFDGVQFMDEVMIFDPKNVRSINAEFDPTKADSADLLSSRQSERQMSALRGIA